MTVPKLFHVLADGSFVLSEDARGMNSMKNVIDEFGENSGKVFAYLHYMNDLNPDTNPYAGIDEALKQEVIIRQTCPELDLVDNDVVDDANELVAMCYDTDGYKMYKAFKIVWEELAKTLSTGGVSMGQDGNWRDVNSAVKSYKDLRESLKMALKDFQEELGVVVAKGGRERNKFSGKSKELD